MLSVDTRGSISLSTLLVKHYNYLLDRQNSGRSRNELTCFSVGNVFIHLGTYVRKFSRNNLPRIFSLKNRHTKSQGIYKKVPNREACKFIPAPSRILSIKRIIVVVELMQPCVSIFLKQIS